MERELKGGTIEKYRSDIMAVPVNQADIQNMDTVIERLRKNCEFDLISVDVEDSQDAATIQFGYKGEVYSAELYIESAYFPDMYSINHKFIEEEYNALTNSELGVTVCMVFQDSAVYAFHMQIKLLCSLVEEVLGIVDFSSTKIISGKWAKLAAESHVPPSPDYIYSVHAISGDNNDVWIHTHGLNRCGMVELEVLGSDTEHWRKHFDVLNAMAKMGVSNGELPEEEQPKYLIDFGDDELVVTWVDWKEALKHHSSIKLGSFADRVESHNVDTAVLLAYKSEEDEEERIFTHISAYNDHLADNPLIMFTDDETARMKALAEERFSYFSDYFNKEGNYGLIKFGIEVDEEHREYAPSHEHIWFEAVEIHGDTIKAVLTQDPYYLGNYENGGEYELNRSSITDWIVYTDSDEITPDSVYVFDKVSRSSSNIALKDDYENNPFLKQLQQWHEDDEYDNIIEAIQEIPQDERDYELKGQLARALNNVEKFQDALDILDSISSEGVNDVSWHFRRGYALVYLLKYDEALVAFNNVLAISPNDSDAQDYVELCKSEIVKTKPSFLHRCNDFWQWFAANEETLSHMITKKEDYDADAVVDFISEGTSLISEQLSFDIGGDFEFVFRAEGASHLFYLMPFLVSKMPVEFKDTWKFFPYAPGGVGADFEFRIYDKTIKVSDVHVSAEYDEEANGFIVKYHHPEFNTLIENKRINAFAILMELVIGESLAYMYVNIVESSTELEDDMFPLHELDKNILSLLEDNGATLFSEPATKYSVYSFEPEESEELRMDIYIGTTCYSDLVNDYFANDHYTIKGVEEYGAKAMFLAIPLPEGGDGDELLQVRHTIEDRLQGLLIAEGIVTGGATGENTMYIDLLLFDWEKGEVSKAMIEKLSNTLQEFQMRVYLSEFRQNSELVRLV